MKKIWIALTVCTAALLGACSLDEYNPSSIDESKMSTFEGLRATQAYCYSPLYGQMCDKEDFLFLTEGGSDLWNNPNNGSYAQEVIYYESLAPAAENKGWSKVFLQAYSALALCNTVLEKAPSVSDGQGDAVAVLVAETRFLRAYYHLLLTTHYGPITLVLSAPTENPDLLPKRNTLTEIYTSITDDLKAAYADLKDTPFEGNRQRPTKAAALGLLARAYVQGAGQGLSENGKSYWTLARETAEQVLSAYPDRWYNDVKEVWNEKNNRDNKEALFVAAGPDPTKMSKEDWDRSYKNENKLFRQTIFDIRRAGQLLDDEGANKKTLVWNNGHRNYVQGGQPNESLAPSKYYLDCFNPDWDRRWEYTFQTAFGGWSIPAIWDAGPVVDFEGASFTWSERLCDLYGVDKQHVGKTIRPYFNCGDDAVNKTSVIGYNQYPAFVWPRNATGVTEELIDPMTTTGSGLVIDPAEVFDVNENRIFLYLSKKKMTAAEKAPYPFSIVNIDDLFTSEGVYWTGTELTDEASGNIFVQMASGSTKNSDLGKVRPVMIKFNQTSIGMTGNNQQVKTADIFLLRMAEMHLIAAEAYAVEGNGAKAAEHLNALRQRAVRPGYTGSDWRLSSASMEDVYDEYARELGGEFSRWALLQRHQAFKERLLKYNKRAYDSYAEHHIWRPISQNFLNSIDNKEEYGDNGYGTTASSGLDGYLK